MKDKLHFKRIWWPEVIDILKLNNSYCSWLKKKKRNLSANRLAYCFLKSHFGIEWIKRYRVHPYDLDEEIRIAKTPWIKFLEE